MGGAGGDGSRGRAVAGHWKSAEDKAHTQSPEQAMEKGATNVAGSLQDQQKPLNQHSGVSPGGAWWRSLAALQEGLRGPPASIRGDRETTSESTMACPCAGRPWRACPSRDQQRKHAAPRAPPGQQQERHGLVQRPSAGTLSRNSHKVPSPGCRRPTRSQTKAPGTQRLAHGYRGKSLGELTLARVGGTSGSARGDGAGPSLPQLLPTLTPGSPGLSAGL